MKKALLLVIGIVAVCFLIANADYLASFLATLKTGALVPLVVACALMLARHLVQAASYDAAFEAVGHKTGFWHNVVLIFSLVFINTFCLFSGATGVAFIIDDAHRRGCDAGQSTSGAILSQIGYFAAILVISVIGFVTMLVSGSMNTLFLVGGLALAAVLAVLSSMFVAGYRKPRILFRLFLGLESLINKALGLLKRHLKPGWGRKTAGSFISSASILAKNPQGTLVTVAYASFSAILNMACLVAIGYAFGFTHVTALVAAFAVAAYTGFLLGVVKAYPLWNNAILPILFVVSALSAGLAATSLVGLVTDRERFEHMWLIKKSHVILSAIEMVVLFTMLVIVSAGSFEGAASVSSLIAGQYAPAFWGGIVILGLVAPFCIEGYPVFIAKRVETSTTSLVVSLIGEAGVLVGGFLLRLLVILAALPVLFL